MKMTTKPEIADSSLVASHKQIILFVEGKKTAKGELLLSLNYVFPSHPYGKREERMLTSNLGEVMRNRCQSSK